MVVGEQVSAKSTKPSLYNSQTMPLPIAAANYDVNPDKSFDTVPVVGDTLNADLASTNIGTGETSTQISTYTVREGDSYSSVAKMFNVSINTLLWANNLNSRSILKVGQTLDILPVTGIKYTIQKNDTILAIAKKYHADADEIYNYNDLDASSKLVIGQDLIIPDAEMSITPAVSGIKRIKGQIYEPIIGDIKNLPSYPGYYACPVTGGRLTQELHGRNAIDLAAPIGTRLKASAAGTIIISKSNSAWNGGYGNFVVVSHNNGTQTLYAHMSSSAVSVGDQVSQGQTIGYIGMTGLTTGPHTHFEIRGAKNPFAYTGCN
jgi:LysM repeat protein